MLRAKRSKSLHRSMIFTVSHRHSIKGSTTAVIVEGSTTAVIVEGSAIGGGND